MFVLKLVLAPALVVLSSLAGRRWGQQVSGLLVALPIVAGPILLITCLDQGARFGSRAAGAALLGLMTLAVFALMFAWLAQFFGWVPTLLISWTGCVLLDLVLSAVPVDPRLGLPVVLVVALIAARLLPAPSSDDGGPVRWPWWDLPARAVATAALVVIVTGAATTLGPGMTGVLAPFPIATSVVAVFALARLGPAGAVRVLHGIPRGLLGFSVFCFLVAVLVIPLGTGFAFVIGVAATLATQAAWRAVTARRAVMRGRAPQQSGIIRP